MTTLFQESTPEPLDRIDFCSDILNNEKGENIRYLTGLHIMQHFSLCWFNLFLFLANLQATCLQGCSWNHDWIPAFTYTPHPSHGSLNTLKASALPDVLLNIQICSNSDQHSVHMRIKLIWPSNVAACDAFELYVKAVALKGLILSQSPHQLVCSLYEMSYSVSYKL